MTDAPPPPSRGASRVFGHYLDRLFRRTFATVRWHSLTDWTTWADNTPTLAIANHTSWWDGFLSHQVSRAMGRPFRILMEAEHLARYPVFRRVGALPIERRAARQAVRDLAVAGACLVGDTTLWIYPQGMRRPAAEPPTRLERGAAWLIAHHPGSLRVLPVAFRYTFLSEQRPEAFALLGEPRVLRAPTGDDRRTATVGLAEALCETLAVLDADLATERVEHYAVLVTGRLSVNNRLDRMRHALGLLPDYRTRNG